MNLESKNPNLLVHVRAGQTHVVLYPDAMKDDVVRRIRALWNTLSPIEAGLLVHMVQTGKSVCDASPVQHSSLAIHASEEQRQESLLEMASEQKRWNTNALGSRRVSSHPTQ